MSETRTYVESRLFTAETWDGPSDKYPDLNDGKPVDSDGNYFVVIFDRATYIKKGWKILTSVDGKTKIIISPEKFESEYCQSPASIQATILSLEQKLERVNQVEWSETPPTEQGWYWHWFGDPDSAPVPTSVMWSGTSGKCFVTAGQLGLDSAIDCDKYGGFWTPLKEPSTALAEIERK